MFAVESVRDGHRDGVCAKIVREHRCPREGLKQRPMCAEHRRERENETDFADADEHKIKLVKNFTKSKIKTASDNFKFQQSKPKSRLAANRKAESNLRPPDECSRRKSAGRWIFGPPCRGCKCSARANPHLRRR
jgi:hypothetical protein